jgi:hypothetical protein
MKRHVVKDFHTTPEGGPEQRLELELELPSVPLLYGALKFQRLQPAQSRPQQTRKTYASCS